MRITNLELCDFRSYESWSLEPDSALTVFVGPNAVGKTNIMEAIQLVSTGTSFRGAKWDEVVRWGAEQARIHMTAEGATTHADVDVTVEKDGSRTWKVGGVKKRRPSEATKFVPVVAFTPDDLALVKGSSEQRRSAIDGLGEQLSATYGSLRRDYARIVRQRNTVLKDEGPDAALEPWTSQLINLGARLHVHRRRLAQRVLEAAAPIYQHLSKGERLDLRLEDRCGLGPRDVRDVIEADEILSALTGEIARRRTDERARKVSLVGPHRDDIVFLIDDREARTYGSQGQQRTIALAWKWAEVHVVNDVLHKTPVLLLDDVMSELDDARRAALTELVQRDVQTFVTTTTTAYFQQALLRQARVVQLGGGS